MFSQQCDSQITFTSAQLVPRLRFVLEIEIGDLGQIHTQIMKQI